jgi:hypothetical protein
MKTILILITSIVFMFSSVNAAEKIESLKPVSAQSVEVEVDQLGKARTRESIWNIKPDAETISKYPIEGTVFGIGDPVHEMLTVKALVDSGTAKKGISKKDSEIADYIRGVFWNDDPCAQLFADDDLRPLRPSFGVSWFVDFKSAGNNRKKPQEFKKLKCELLGRSHFGDLQFLHGMADRDGEKAEVTANQMLAWASVMYRIAIGAIDANKPLDTDETAKNLLGPLSARSPMNLLGAKDVVPARKRALGSLLHMIQDSYSHAHVTREVNSKGDETSILQFLSYVNQDSKAHAHEENWSVGNTDVEKTLNVPGARRALSASIEICKLYKLMAPWAKVEQYLKAGPMLMSENTKVSGSGNLAKLQ